jgi:hypothetical protein
LQMQEWNHGGMGNLVLCLRRLTEPKDDDWRLTEGAGLTMYLWDEPKYKKKPTWNPWVSVRKLTIDNAGNGLFAAREFQQCKTVGLYVGNVVYKYLKKWTAMASKEVLQEQQALWKITAEA